MTEKKHHVPKKLVQGKTGKSIGAEPPRLAGRGGNINTSLRDIHWTPAKLSIVSTALLAPFTFVIIVAFNAGNTLVGTILIGLAVFVGLMYLALRYIENNEF